MKKRLVNHIRLLWASSIRRQLMLGITLVHAILMTVFVLDLVERQRDFLHKHNIEQTKSLAETLSANSVSWVLANDVVGIEEIIDAQKGYPNLRYAMILSPEGRVIAHSNKTYNGQYATDEKSRVLLEAEIVPQYLQVGLMLVDIAVPIVANEKFIGWARVAISGDIYAAGLQVISRDGVIYTIIAIVIGGLFAFVMARGMTADLRKLVDVASSVSGGATRRAVINREDEIGELAKDFNIMLDALERNAHSQKLLEQELRSRRDSLEEQVKERTIELEHARDEALQATVVKSAFLASMSHELRTPLNSIIGFTAIVAMKKAGDLNDEQVRQLNMANASAQHLLEMINDILDISKVEAGKEHIVNTYFDVNGLLTELGELMAPQFEKKNLAIRFEIQEPDMELYTDREKLRRVLLNLLSNALKFTDEGGVTVRCKKEKQGIVIHVEDTGIGIGKDDIENVFNAFEQADSHDSRKYTGTGLGLTICRQYIQLLGGEITVRSTPGRGSRFSILLPVSSIVSHDTADNIDVRG